jgi:hypothetical protein
MSDPEVPFTSQALTKVSPPKSTQTQCVHRLDKPPIAKPSIANTLLHLGRGASAAPARGGGGGAGGRTRHVDEKPALAASSHARSQREHANVLAMRDAVTDISSAATRARTRKLCATGACPVADLKYAGMTPRHYRISLIASERLIAKLARASALVGENDNETSVAEVLELAVDTLLHGLHSG